MGHSFSEPGNEDQAKKKQIASNPPEQESAFAEGGVTSEFQINLRTAAEQGNAEAQYQCGLYCEVGADSKPEDAVMWYRKAAHQGHARAQYQLGMCYFTGTGLEKNEAEALQWIRQAAAQGEPQAERMLRLLGD